MNVFTGENKNFSKIVSIYSHNYLIYKYIYFIIKEEEQNIQIMINMSLLQKRESSN
ncbi:hypothetical protein APHACPA_1641 [Rickettsia amblyommatis str. Ac/Pa]|uniref:Uncharacterized protein n=1 Tax=Rickettsia amblyommatis str. Ac/Pa TaxID=1359164 RepID=A0A0F3N3M0_RICAM|nr:hypothetical protein APHACPA_1641 [Rickettsia amblyommatis str. Ac/Pa]